MTVGIADQNKIYYARGAGPDQPVIYVGSKTGRDGIHGATMASATFDDETEAKRPTVQVGDPFTEKLLLEACLELMQKEAIISIQDMGAAGLTSSSVEIANKGKIGIDLDLDKVPQREENMTPYELMLSESQERMLMVLQPGKEELARRIFEKWDLDFAVIGQTTKEQSLKLTMHGKCWCDIPVPPLVDEAPIYDRPRKRSFVEDMIDPDDYPLPLGGLKEALKKMISSPALASKRWIWEQYDHLVMGETVTGPEQADAALVKIPGKDKALAITSDCNPHYCKADPFEGGVQSVAESYRNISATGAMPLAITNNLNFGNPEKPEIMDQLIGCIEGITKACEKLDYPVISGNVSLYNETNGEAILPTPVIGGVGLLPDWHKRMTIGFKAEGEAILLIGETGGHLGQSLYLREIHGTEAGPPPPVNLARERRHSMLVRKLNEMDLITACHDISDGGLLCAVAEMAMASGIGAIMNFKTTRPEFWFCEDQSRYIITTNNPDAILDMEECKICSITILGYTNGKDVKPGSGDSISVDELKHLNERWLPEYMDS